MKRLLKISGYTAVVLLLLMAALVGLVSYTPVQNYLVHQAADVLSRKLKTKVEVAHIRIDFLNHVVLQGVYVQDQAQDTLLYAGEASLRITDWFVFRDRPVIHYVGLKNAYAHLYRSGASDVWNYEFIIDAFGSSKSSAESRPFDLNLKKMELTDVRVHMDDKWSGENLDFDIGFLGVDGSNIDGDKKRIDINSITTRNALVSVSDYKAAHQPSLHSGSNALPAIDTTPFNPAKWQLSTKSLSLEDCSFRLTMNDNVPVPGEFDQNHIIINKIRLKVADVNIIGDTIHGAITDLSAQERCGIAIKKMKARVTVSPIASVCENLYLETNNSKVQNYYAMHYRRFPDFTQYIDSVVMVARMTSSVVDASDIAYFAPQLKTFPKIQLQVDGSGKGTVANLSARQLKVSDGNTAFKGDINMKGLPDIYKTWITCTDAELITTGAGVLRYVPWLRNSPDVALDKISYAWFKGGYEGYVENFKISGMLKTNLGSMDARIKMNIPGFKANTAVYSGDIVTTDLQLGIFLKQPLLGAVTLNEDFSGNSFNPDLVALNIDGFVKQITINDYAYQNITTHGTLARKQFTGKLQVDDPNLALAFDGGFNYANKNINVKATANLLACNFKALKLTTDDFTGSADFDLDCTGSNIDNFSGYAKLNNIDVKRNAHKLALDSVFINAGGDSLHKLLTVQSNNVLATIKGDYKLSNLAASVQFYLSRYLPNYIKTPEKYAPNQNFSFTVKTFDIDSILAVTIPLVRGFDSSDFSGSLNTYTHKITLNALVPYGSIGKVHMRNINISGDGNLDMIALNTTIDNVSVGDSVLNGSLSLTATVGSDSVGFTIATTSPEVGTSITLNGGVVASRDSLFLTLHPSEFYLNQVKWDIAGGSKVVYSNKYLDIEGFSLSSGLQKISASTMFQNNAQSVIIATENLDIGQLGAGSALSTYQPDGRVNGTIAIENLFGDLRVSANLKATGVMLGTDTVGNITVIGDYDAAKKLVSFDPQTGIYRDNASMSVSGNISFDSTTNQKLDGVIQFSNAPVVWASPFLTGIMSHLSGSLDGAIKFNGTSYSPEMDGTVLLKNGAMRLDFMGCNYTIPAATIHIDNKSISFGRVTAYDVYKNTATISGNFSHNLFRDMKMAIRIRSEKFEVMNLTANDNNLFYGNVIAGMDSFTIYGPFNNISLAAYNAVPAAKSRIYIPENSTTSGNDAGYYSFASFKTYGKNQDKLHKASKSRISIYIDANLNPLAEMHIVLDPATGDEIMAKGDGRISMYLPPNNDISINGLYNIYNGLYTFTFKSLFLKKNFVLDAGSSISFNGPFAQTTLDVHAVYTTKARLVDLLNEGDKNYITGSELIDDQTPQLVNVSLHMDGFLSNPRLTYDVDLDDKHSQSTIAYQKLKLINNDDRQKLNQVASLLLINSFIPPDGIGGNTVASGALNNISQVVSSSTSTALTSVVNKLLAHDQQVNVDVKYTNYNYSDQGVAANRNEVKVDVNKPFLNDRLLVEAGTTSDWGKPASASATSNFNFTGDFRIQYKLLKASGLRLSAFRTSDYDVTLDRDIVRSGVGINWRKSFDNVGDFFRGSKYEEKQKQKQLQQFKDDTVPDSLLKKSQGTE